MSPAAPPSPPRRAERLLRWSLSPDDRQPQLGDLQEEFATLAERSPAAAWRWYWRQALTSVVPNVLRRVRHGWQLISRIADEKDRRSRRWRRWIGVALAAAGVALGVGLSIGKGDWSWLEDGLPAIGFGLALGLTSLYRVGGPAPSRRTRLFQIVTLLVCVATFVEAGTKMNTSHWRYPMWALQGLLWFWPRGTWPFHRPASVTEYSLRSPLYVFRQYGRPNYEPITVPNLPFAISEPILGEARPISVPPESQIEGVVPMSPTSSREFSAADSLRVFTVVNAAPDDLQAAVEIRRTSTGRLLGTIPAAVAPAVSMATPTQKFRIDPDDEPLTPSPIRVSEVDAVISLAGLAPDEYTLRVVAHHPEGSSFARVDITVLPQRGRW